MCYCYFSRLLVPLPSVPSTTPLPLYSSIFQHPSQSTPPPHSTSPPITHLRSAKILVARNLVDFTKAASPKIKVESVFVTNLATALAAPILAPLEKPWVSI